MQRAAHLFRRGGTPDGTGHDAVEDTSRHVNGGAKGVVELRGCSVSRRVQRRDGSAECEPFWFAAGTGVYGVNRRHDKFVDCGGNICADQARTVRFPDQPGGGVWDTVRPGARPSPLVMVEQPAGGVVFTPHVDDERVLAALGFEYPGVPSADDLRQAQPLDDGACHRIVGVEDAGVSNDRFHTT